MDAPLVLEEIVEGVGRLTLNHPAKRNALSSAMLEALDAALLRTEAESGVGVVVLRAAGAVFSSGHDLREMVGVDRATHETIFARCTRVMERIRRLSKPVIAEVQGLATAAGCQLVATCDLAIASTEAKFATPGVKIGLFCSTPAVPLCRAVPVKKAMEMLLTGQPIDAAEAERLGLVNRVVPPEQLSEAVLALARQILETSRSTLVFGKRTFYEQLPCAVPEAYRIAQAGMVENAQSADGQEGMSAFLEKRPARWKQVP